MKKVVLKLDFADEKIKQKVMKKVSGLSGVESIAFDQKDKKLTITGDMDPLDLVSKVKKICSTDIVSVGPAKEPEKKKEEPKKEEPKKDEPKKGDDKKKEEAAKAYPLPAYYYHNPYYQHQYQYQYQQPPVAAAPLPPPPYYHRSVEEDPNGCVIC